LGRKGVFPIAPTPFLADGSIDAASVDRMIARTIVAYYAQAVERSGRTFPSSFKTIR
jgi:dihydrodipicolinate synthase/N-acetylneuraminate lyase